MEFLRLSEVRRRHERVSGELTIQDYAQTMGNVVYSGQKIL